MDPMTATVWVLGSLFALALGVDIASRHATDALHKRERGDEPGANEAGSRALRAIATPLAFSVVLLLVMAAPW